MRQAPLNVNQADNNVKMDFVSIYCTVIIRWSYLIPIKTPSVDLVPVCTPIRSMLLNLRKKIAKTGLPHIFRITLMGKEFAPSPLGLVRPHADRWRPTGPSSSQALWPGDSQPLHGLDHELDQ